MALTVMSGCGVTVNAHSLQRDIEKYLDGVEARIGVAVISDGNVVAEVRGGEMFEMQSVYKLPIALACTDSLYRRGETKDYVIEVNEDDIKKDTYSPMRDVYGSLTKSNISLETLLKYSLQLSDNNASDILLKQIGGPESVQRYLCAIGVTGINVLNSEDEMHKDVSLCKKNSASPLALARFIDQINRCDTLASVGDVLRILENCSTGANRIPSGIDRRKCQVMHKTGSGNTLGNGGMTAVNDAGYVRLNAGGGYAIVVLINDSPFGMEECETIISEISRKVFTHLSR